MLTVKQFIETYTGWAKDVDGAAGIQCVDLAKEHFRLAGMPGWSNAIGGDGYADNIWYNRLIYADYYDLINREDGFKDGDMVIFPHKARGGWTHPESHVCFYYQGKEFGTNQGQKPACLKNTDWSDALGALRWKQWNGEFLPYGYSIMSRSGITAHVYRGNRAGGYSLHVLSADGKTDLKDITEFDTPEVLKVAVVNAGYFQMEDKKPDPVGTHYGVEQDAAAGNSYTQAPKQSGILAFYEGKDGSCHYCNGDEYYGTPEEVNFAITPYAVRIHEGKKVFGRSVNYGDKDDLLNEQTAAVKFDNGDWAVAVFPEKIHPRDTVTFFDNFQGVMELILMDSGGSSQMLAWNNTEKKMEKKIYTKRALPNVLIIAKITGETVPADLEPVTEPVIIPEIIEPEKEEHMSEQNSDAVTTIIHDPLPVTNQEWKDPEPTVGATIAQRISSLLSVKSIVTIALTSAFIMLVINERPLPEDFTRIYLMVISFFFGYQFEKSAK